MKPCLTMMGLFALLVCTACSSTSKTSMNLAADQPQQITSIQWDEVTASREAAKVANNGLIMSR